jgi:hypothetical protein
MPAPAFSAAARLPASGWLKILLLVVLFCGIYGRDCLAATWSITQTTLLNFGALQIPGGSVYRTIDYNGVESGTGTFLYNDVFGTATEGIYTIKCTGGGCGTFSLNVSPFGASSCGTGSSPTGTYDGSLLSGPPPWNNLANPGSAGKTFKSGLTVTYDNTAPSGSCFLNYIISAGTASTDFSPLVVYDVGLSLTKNSDINFGTVTANNASTYRISTAGTVTTVSGTGSYVTGATSAGSITIAGSTTEGITISAGGYTANNGVTPSNAQCSYNGGASGSCSITTGAPGAGKTLLIGVDVATDGTQAGGTTAAPSFTISAAYQ